jgi:Ca2+-binding EF-hand superfamily protein
MMKKTQISLACLLLCPIVSFALPAWKAFDKNKDDALSLAEFASYKSDLYAELDMNGDGKWSRSEFVKGLRDIKGIDPHWLREKFARFDKNDNRSLSLEEAENEIAKNFKWLDKDKSKSITPKEMPKRF